MDRETLRTFLFQSTDQAIGEEVFERDCAHIEFLLNNCEISVPKNSRFFVQTNADGLQGEVYRRRVYALSNTVETEETKLGIDTYAYTGSYDFSHTTPYWEEVLSLGVYGLFERVRAYRRQADTPRQIRFFDGCIKVYDAALRFLTRASDAARAVGKTEMADGLQFLTSHAPQNLYQKLQLFFIFYLLQHTIETTYLRTLGRLDSLLYNDFVKENEEYALRLIEDFIQEIDTLQAPSNIPFAIGGTDEWGNSLYNPLSYAILEAYGKLNTTNTKFHILYAQNTPDDLIKRAFTHIRAGKNSIVFISDTTAIEGLKLLGASHKNACNYHVVGCYECGAEGELTCSCNARINLTKALEVTLNAGKDMGTGVTLHATNEKDFDDFESLYSAFENTLLTFTKRALFATDEWEKQYKFLHASPFLSSTYPSALERGGDLYGEYTANYNNSSINALGLATTVDSLAAIKTLVFERRKYSLSEFVEILKNNWENQEILRLQIKNTYPKYGTGNRAVDELAQRIINTLARFVNGKPNAKGGVWRLGTFSIDWRWEFGEHTHASANGRKSGETLSQNTSATFGADKLGATGHLLSVSSFPHTLTPNGSIVDIDLHSSAVRGENGLTALLATLKTYVGRKGLAVHYNILDTDTLKRAKENPDAYPALQVRLCGWNVLFSSLSEREKEEFIARSIKGD